MEIGVFIPIGNNGWLISTNSPQYRPSFELNREVVQRAEHYGLEFVLSMIKLRGFGGKSEFWDYNLESFTLMAGLAAVTSRIRLYATAATLVMPPAIVARMAVTIDSISKGRFGVNLITGWQKAEYDQMGMWPGEMHYTRRYDVLAEYTQVMKDLWTTGRCDLKGEFFTMNDCRLAPQPQAKIKLVAACRSDEGMQFAAKYCDYNFCGGASAINEPLSTEGPVGRLRQIATETNSGIGALATAMIIADETDEAAWAKWEHYKAGTDIEALSWSSNQAAIDTRASEHSTKAFRVAQRKEAVPNNGNRLIGSYAAVARMLDEMAEVEGLGGIMLTFDDFIIGIEQFGQRIQPLMQSRRHRTLAMAAE
jgi:pyrimidine oxygenase